MRRTKYGFLMLLCLCALWPAGGAAADAGRVEQGKQVYQREGCPMCHALQGKRNRRNPLDGVATRLSPEAMRKWIVAPQEMKPGIKKKAYALSAPDLDALIDYLTNPMP